MRNRGTYSTWSSVDRAKSAYSHVSLCFAAGSDDDTGVLFMALMAHDTTKFDGVMRARKDTGNTPDFPNIEIETR